MLGLDLAGSLLFDRKVSSTERHRPRDLVADKEMKRSHSLWNEAFVLIGPNLVADPQIFDQEAHEVGLFLDDLRGPFAGTVTGFGFDADQDRSGTRLSFLKRRRVLETVSREDAVVVIGRRCGEWRLLLFGPLWCAIVRTLFIRRAVLKEKSG